MVQVAHEIYRMVMLTIPYIAITDAKDPFKDRSSALLEKAKLFGYIPKKAIELLNPYVDGEAPYKVSDVR